MLSLMMFDTSQSAVCVFAELDLENVLAFINLNLSNMNIVVLGQENYIKSTFPIRKRLIENNIGPSAHEGKLRKKHCP